MPHCCPTVDRVRTITKLCCSPALQSRGGFAFKHKANSSYKTEQSPFMPLYMPWRHCLSPPRLLTTMVLCRIAHGCARATWRAGLHFLH